MNFPTHVMLGIAVGALFFGKPELILLVAIGSALPDLDREYGFLSKESFTQRQVHRALCHNFVFLGLVYLINPFLALGAFLHTLLDALTTARDRGVEWLYPFTRLAKRAVYDYNGNRMEFDPNIKIYLLQNELPVLTKKTTKDLKPGEQTLPWRRTYGPALSGKLLDQGIFYGSLALTLLLLLFSALGFQKFIDLTFHSMGLAFTLPLFVGAVGGLLNFVEGEIDRKKLAEREKSWFGNRLKPDRIYKALFYLSIGMMTFAVILGAVMNPEITLATARQDPYIVAGVAVLGLVSVVLLKNAASKPLPIDNQKEPAII